MAALSGLIKRPILHPVLMAASMDGVDTTDPKEEVVVVEIIVADMVGHFLFFDTFQDS